MTNLRRWPKSKSATVLDEREVRHAHFTLRWTPKKIRDKWPMSDTRLRVIVGGSLRQGKTI